MWDPPGSRIKPVSLASQDRFLLTGPPEKPQNLHFKNTLGELFCTKFEEGFFIVNLFNFQHCGHLGSGKSSWWRTVLRIVGCFATPLTAALPSSSPPPPHHLNSQKYLQTLPGVPGEQNCLWLTENPCLKGFFS